MKDTMAASRPEGAKGLVERAIPVAVKCMYSSLVEHKAEMIAAFAAEYAREQENPKECDPCDGDDCERCRGTGLYCVNCEAYTRATDLWQALLADERSELAHAVVIETDLRAQLQTLRGEKQTLEDVLADERAELAHAVEVENALTQEKAALEAALAGIRNVSDDKTRIIEALEARERALVVALDAALESWIPMAKIIPGGWEILLTWQERNAGALAPRRG